MFRELAKKEEATKSTAKKKEKNLRCAHMEQRIIGQAATYRHMLLKKTLLNVQQTSDGHTKSVTRIKLNNRSEKK